MSAYRYMLTRTIDPLLRVGPTMLFVMLNPSTADDRVDDPTIRRCISFAAREGASLLQVVNLYALRSTNPRDLILAKDANGERNDVVLIGALQIEHARIVCAWGAHPMAEAAMPRFRDIHASAGSPPLWCLGTTKDGAPRHPLYVRADAPLVTYAA